MLKKINKLQEELLKVNNYFVLPELFVIKDNSSDRPFFNIYFDPNSGTFGLQVFPVMIQDREAMQGYSKQLEKRFKLICELNDLEGYGED